MSGLCWRLTVGRFPVGHDWIAVRRIVAHHRDSGRHFLVDLGLEEVPVEQCARVVRFDGEPFVGED